MSFWVSGQFALLRSLWVPASIERIIKPILQKALTHAPNGRFTHPKGFADLLIRPHPFRAFEQALGMPAFACWRLAFGDHRFSHLTLLLAEWDAMFFH